MSTTDHYVTWMLKKHHRECAEIDGAYTEDDLMRFQENKKVSAIVVIDESDVVRGFMIYRVEDTYIEIVRLVIDRVFRRQGAGSALLAKLVSKLKPLLFSDVPERALAAQLFFRHAGFLCIGTNKDDSYRFEYRK